MAFRVKDHEVINNDGHPTMFGHQEKIASVQIGTQIWMAENLRVKHYRNGDPIPTGYSNSDWADLDDPETGAYAVYDDNPMNEKVYGLLYNWYAVNDSRGLAPEGWHIPSYDEFDTLQTYVENNYTSNDAYALKEAGFVHWNTDAHQIAATNATGFTAIGAGGRGSNGDYLVINQQCNFWTTIFRSASGEAWYFSLWFDSANGLFTDGDLRTGFSVRCIKDT